MKDLLDQLKREVRRLRNDVAPSCSDESINTLMDIHDELLRTIRKIENAMRSQKTHDGSTGETPQPRASTSR
jgi:hypothetical protein